MSISSSLIAWYRVHHRALPWRETADPYKIWLSEVILQQTRVDQGLPYYQRFVEAYPSVSDLAAAPDEQVMKLWQGLGYYSRARNLLAAARIITGKYNRVFPSDYLNIRKLPGIGDYTAAAVASFSFNLPYAVVDGNVTRVISRVFGIEVPIDSPEGKKIISQIASEQLNIQLPALHNQAIMEFGAMLCKPAKPDCSNCFLQHRCEALRMNKVGILPVKLKKTKVRNRYFNYLLIRYKNSIFLNQRGAGDIWQNLFELPLIETDEPIPANQISQTSGWKKILGEQPVHINQVIERKVHKLSHQNIHTRVFDIQLNKKPGLDLLDNFLEVSTQKAVNYAVPKVIESIFEESLSVYTSR